MQIPNLFIVDPRIGLSYAKISRWFAASEAQADGPVKPQPMSALGQKQKFAAHKQNVR
jgi:hypothetical protein